MLNDPPPEEIECPFCKESITKDSKKCKHCKADLNAQPVPKNESEKELMIQKQNRPVVPWLIGSLVVLVLILIAVLNTKKMNSERMTNRDVYSSPPIITQSRQDDTENRKVREQPAAAEAEKISAFNGHLAIEMVLIPGGTFRMGSDSGEGDDDEQPVHTVTISAFNIGKTEVTQGQWLAVMGSNPSYFKKGDNYPVEQVSWGDCQEFIRKLNEQTGKSYRLPTEAEWEYACRAGTTGDCYGEIDSIAWYIGNSGSSTHPVGQKQANGFGLYDMLGNVWEWCSDWGGTYTAGNQIDPTDPDPALGRFRVCRGGGWYIDAGCVRSANRNSYFPGYCSSGLGFRLASGSGGG